MLAVDVALAPYRATKLVAQTIGDAHESTLHMLRGDDPFSQLRDAILEGLEDLDAVATTTAALEGPLTELNGHAIKLVPEVSRLTGAASELTSAAREVAVSTTRLTQTATELLTGGREPDQTATELLTGGRELTQTATSLDGHTAEIITGGKELTDTAKHLDANAKQLNANAEQFNELAASLDASLRVFRAVLPQLLGALNTVEELGESLETVADTIEPPQATAQKAGRVTERLSRKDATRS